MLNGIELDFGVYQVDPDKLIYCKGLDAADFEVQTSTLAQFDGSIVDNRRIGNRYIDIAFTIKEEERERLIRYFNVKNDGELTVTRNNISRVVYYNVQKFSATPDQFTHDVDVVLNLICTDPFLHDVSEYRQALNNTVGLIGFPRSIRHGVMRTSFAIKGDIFIVANKGNENVGFIVEFTAIGNATNPKIQKANGEFIEVFIPMQAGEVLTISTIKGDKYVRKNGVDIMQKINRQSTFFSLDVGFNEIKYSALSGRENVNVVMYRTPKYWGL